MHVDIRQRHTLHTYIQAAFVSQNLCNRRTHTAGKIVLLNGNDTAGFLCSLDDRFTVNRLNGVQGDQANVNALLSCCKNSLLCFVANGSTEDDGSIIAVLHSDGFAQLKLERAMMNILLVFIAASVEHRTFILENCSRSSFCFLQIARNNNYHIRQCT